MARFTISGSQINNHLLMNYESPDKWDNPELNEVRFRYFSAGMHEATQELINWVRRSPESFPHRAELIESVNHICSLLPIIDEE